MNLEIVLAIILTLSILILSIKKLRGFKFDVRIIVRIGVVAAITIVLYMIKLVPFPQGGGCSLLSILPIMLIAVLFSTEEALVCAIIVAIIRIIIQPPYFPLQIPLDYFGTMMAVAFTPMFGIDKKSKLVFGVVVSDETNMHTKYLMDYGLDVYKVDNMKIEPENRNYLDYMLSFIKGGDIKEIFISALPCTLTYEYIGKALKKESGDKLVNNYYGPWIEAYGGKEFEKFSVDSCKLLDRICENIDEEEEEKLIKIFLKACECEINFWDMSYK